MTDQAMSDLQFLLGIIGGFAALLVYALIAGAVAELWWKLYHGRGCRGGVVRIRGYGVDVDKGPFVDVFVSDAGQSIQVWWNNETRMILPGELGADTE